MRKQLHFNSGLKSTITSFTGKKRVNQLAGKNLGIYSLFTSQGDALSPYLPYLALWVCQKLARDPHVLSSTLRSFAHFFLPTPQTTEGVSGFGFSRRSHLLLLCLSLLMLLPDQTWAHTGDLFTNEIGKVEKLLTGGYMRLGLLGVCGATAVMGALQQNAWMFITGIFAGIFAYFMRDWILSTFSMVI